MSKDNNVGVNFNADVHDLKVGLQETAKQIKTLDKEFKATTSSMDDWKKSQDGIEAKLTQLNGTLELQRKNVKECNRIYEEAKTLYGENSKQAQIYYDKLLTQEAALGKTEAQIRKYTASLEEIKSSTVEVINPTEKFQNSLSDLQADLDIVNAKFNNATSGMDDWKSSSAGVKAKVDQLTGTLGIQQKKLQLLTDEYDRVSKEQGSTSVEAKKLKAQMLNQAGAVDKTKKKLIDLNNSLKETKESIDKAKEGFTIFKGVVSQLVTNALLGAMQSISTAIAQARDLRRELGLLSATANSTGASFDNAKENLADVASITEDTRAAVEGLNNLMAAGFDGKLLDDITEQLVGASIKWKDTLKFEGLADGLQETLATGKAVGPFAEMLERAGVNLDIFNRGLADCSSKAEVQQYVLNQLSKLGLKGVKDQYEEVNGSLIENNKAAINSQMAMTKISETLEPLSTKLLNLGTMIIEKISPSLQRLVDTITDAANSGNGEKFTDSISKGFVFLIDYVITPVTKFFKFLMNNLPTVIALFATLAARMLAMNVASMVMKLVEAYRAFKIITEGAKIAQAGLNVVMNANPIGLIITLIGLLVTAFVTLWNKSEKFRNFWIKMWEGIKSVTKGVVETIKKLFSGAWDSITKTWSGAIKFFSAIGNGIKDVFKAIASFFSNIFTGAWEAIKSAFSSIGSFFSGVVNTIVGFFKGIPNKMLSIGSDIVKGIWSGISSGASWLSGKIKGWAGSIIEKIKGAFKIKSPSKLMKDEVGKMIGKGVGIGILDSTRGVLSDINKFTSKINSGLVTKLSTIKGGLPVESTSIKAGTSTSNNVNNFTQIINAPKQPSRIELYRQTKNLLALKGG